MEVRLLPEYYVCLLPGTKKPLVKGWATGEGNVDKAQAVKGWVSQGYNVGIVLGRKGTLDVDVDEPGLIPLLEKVLPPTGVVFGRKSRQGKGHFLYRVKGYARHVSYLDEDGNTIVELRWKGHQTAVPPSRLEGDEVVYSRFGEYGEVEFGELREKVEEACVAFLLAKVWPVPSNRHNAYRALAGGLKNSGVFLERAKSIASLLTFVTKDEEPEDRVRCVEDTYTRPLNGKGLEGFGTLVTRISCDEKKAKRILWRVRWILGTKDNEEEQDRRGKSSGRRNRKDLEGEAKKKVSHKVKEQLKDTLKYTDKGYFVYYDREKGVWIDEGDSKDSDNLAHCVIRDCLKKLLEDKPFLEELGEVLKEDPREWLENQIDVKDEAVRIAKWYKQESDIKISEEVFDNPKYLNVKNAVLEFVEDGNGRWRIEVKAQEPWHYCRRQAPVEYDPYADCPTWDLVVSQVSVKEDGSPDPEKEYWLQRNFGYCLHPYNPGQKVFVYYGKGANGKSLLTETVGAIFGDRNGYYWKLSQDVFLKDRKDTHPSARYPLGKVRLALAPELPPKELDAALIKLSAGDATIDVRRMYREHENLPITAKIFMHTNHIPEFKDVTYGFRRKYLVVPFYATFVDGENLKPPFCKRDENIKQKLWEERSGILNRLIEAANKVGAGAGLDDMPASIEEFTKRCIKETSSGMAWFYEMVVVDSLAPAYKFKDVYENYKSHAIENCGEREVLSKRDFSKFLRSLDGVEVFRHGRENTTYVKGIKLLHLGEII